MSDSSVHICDHCGLEFESAAVSDPSDSEALVFCCVGCRAVYHALHEAGLDDFYQHRQIWSDGDAQPVDRAHLHANEHAAFDTPAFLEEQANRLPDGTLRIEMHLEGVHCAGCVWLVERMPHRLAGVIDARLELSRRKVSLHFDPDVTRLSRIARWLATLGFALHPLQSAHVERRNQSARKMLIRVGICWAVAANVMLLTIAIYAGLDPVDDPGLYATVLWTTFALSAVSLIAGGSVFFRRAWASLQTGLLSMDVPISLGILVGWTHSGWSTITGSGEVWFDSIVILIAALLSARYLQIRGNGAAADAAERLVSLLPRTARRIVAPVVGGDPSTPSTEMISAQAVDVGDQLRVHAGELVPADGHVTHGRSDISRAVLTGESRPEKIGVGDFVEAGTTNLSSPLEIEVSATAEATRIGRLMEWIESRATHRAPIVQLADRLGRYFIALVLVAATLTAIAWAIIEPSRAVFNVVALLVIACPCALGMATPLALTVGTGQAARRGIHIKHDDVIEAFHHATDIIFDKTGTLTYGRPTVVDICGDHQAALRACALETQSNHPLAAALVDWSHEHDEAPSHHRQVEAVTETPGAGLAGQVDGHCMRIGRLSWFDTIPTDLHDWAQARAALGLTPVAVSEYGEVRAVFAIGDRLRDSAKQALDSLRDHGIRIHLLSGDHAQVVDAAATSLAIPADQSVGGASPEDKLDYVNRLCHTPGRGPVAMVGDGVNDAAALQAADIGIAVAGGTEASLIAADVFAVRPGLEAIVELYRGTRRIMGVVYRNLAGSGLYNLVGISLAALGFITPLAAAILMPISSLAVVASSLVQNSFDSGAAS